MKKLTFILSLTLLSQMSYAHGWTKVRKNCIWGDRYQAFTQVDKLNAVASSQGGYMVYTRVGTDLFGRPVYRWVYQPLPPASWSTAATDRNVGCTRPKHSYIQYSDVIAATPPPNWQGPYNVSIQRTAWADAVLDFGDIERLNSFSNNAGLKPGSFNAMTIDWNAFSNMDQEGFSQNTIEGGIDFDENSNAVAINNLNGSLKIKSGSNFYSTFHMVVVKERTDATQDEKDELEAQEHDLQFTDVALEGTVTLTKNGVEKSGVFNDIINGDNVTDDGNATILTIQNVSAMLGLDDIQLAPNEELAIITYTDGGFDYAAIGGAANKGIAPVAAAGFAVYPNPATTQLSMTLPEEVLNQQVRISVVDVMGREVARVFEGTATTGTISNAALGNLPSGVYNVVLKSGMKTSYQKLTIAR